MIIHKIIPFVDYNSWLKRLDTQLIELSNQNSVKVSKVIELTNKKRYHQTLGTSVINSPMSPPSLSISEYILEKYWCPDDGIHETPGLGLQVCQSPILCNNCLHM